MTARIDLYSLVLRKKEAILEIAKRRGARNIRIFESVIRGDFTDESDIDLLIDLEPGRSLMDVGGFAMDLQHLLGHHVDVITEAGLRDRIRGKVLREARPL